MAALVLVAFLVILVVRHTLQWLNLRHLRRHGHRIPQGFEGQIDPETLRRTAAYTLDSARVSLIGSVLDSALVLVFLFGGWMGVYDRWVASLAESFVWAGVLFFLGLHYVQTALDVPFSLYRTFRLEARYGFNTTTPRLWVTDLLKSEAIATVLIAVLVACALGLVQWSPDRWWVWVWAFFALFTLFLMYISPYVIEPLFFKFEPVREEGLEHEIRIMVERAGLHVGRVFQVDASRRSRHSNAYFTGIGRVKRIVLFDTLIEQMGHPEILAVLAHEIGHWKKRHILKRIVLTEAVALVALYLAFRLLSWPGLPGMVGLEAASFPARLVILAFVGSIVTFPFTPLLSALSRRHERQADRFACGLTGKPVALASALVKLSKDNLSNLHPHPLYARFYYSHPPLADRVAELRAMSSS